MVVECVVSASLLERQCLRTLRMSLTLSLGIAHHVQGYYSSKSITLIRQRGDHAGAARRIFVHGISGAASPNRPEMTRRLCEYSLCRERAEAASCTQCHTGLTLRALVQVAVGDRSMLQRAVPLQEYPEEDHSVSHQHACMAATICLLFGYFGCAGNVSSEAMNRGAAS